jgi:GT2 family glycosyltransferase
MTIIVPTFNRARYVAATVMQILDQSFKDFELLVIDQSEPAQKKLVRDRLSAALADPRVSYLWLSTPGLPNARNEGLARASGKVILFLDDDVILLNENFLRAHWRCYDDPVVGGVTGRIVERTNRENAKRTMNRITIGGRTLVNLLGQSRCRIDSLKGANMSVRAAVVTAIGGFDRNYTGTALLEDADFAERVRRRGWQLIFEPGAELFHLSAPASGVRVSDPDLTLMFRFRSTAYFVRKHRGILGLLPFAVVHITIGVVKALRSRSLQLISKLIKGAIVGALLAGGEFNQELPMLTQQGSGRSAACCRS